MIQINPLQSYIDGGPRAAITSPPSASLVFDLPGKAIWVKGVKLKGTDHTYTFSHDNYITLTNTPDSNESEDIKIGVNTSALKSAIDTTYGVVSTTANGLAPKFTSENKLAATAATTYYFLGWTGTTLKWYQAPFRNIRINSETTDRLGVNSTDPLIISSGNGISVTWDSTNKKIVITNTKPDVNHNTDRTGIKLATVSGTKKTDSTLILANSTTGLSIQGGTNKFLIGNGTNYIEVPITPSFTITNKDATIGTALTTIATIAGVDIKAKIASYSLSNHTHSVKINGSTKTIAASGAVDLGNYLPLSGGTMSGTAWIGWSDSGNWGNNNSGVTFPVTRGGLQWRGQTDYIKLFSEETGRDNLNLVLQFGDDNFNGLSIRDKSNVQTSHISAGGVITTKTFKGNLDWSYITNKPSSYTPSAHTHAWNSLTHSSTTENQAILTNGSANGWKLYTLNISGWNNAANNAHSHSNKSVLDGITSTLVNNWNTAYNFVNTISGTDTDKVINKWDEIVNFLAGITEDNKLNTLLNNKLSILLLSTKDILTTKTNNALFWVNTISTASSITTGPFTDHPYALLSITNYNLNTENSKFFYRSRLAFSSNGDIKVASCHHENEYKLDETWYNVLTSKNSGISGSTIKLNRTSITVYSSSTADGRYVKKAGDTMSGTLTINTTSFGTLIIKRNDDANGASIQFRGKSNIYGYIGLNNSTKDKLFLRWDSNASITYTILDTSSTYVSSGKGVINGTTITQVDNATNSTNSTNATNARKLVNWYSTRPTSLNTQFGDGSLRIFHATSSTTEGKSPTDATILHLAWDNNGGWDSQLAVNSSGKVYSRGQNAGTWQSWKTLAFTTDIPTSLKNPYSLTIFGVIYDGSAAKTVTTSTFISLVTEGTSTITDGTMFITSYASNSGFADTNAVNVPYKRKAIQLWEYIKTKTDSLYTTKSHNHDDRYYTKSESNAKYITDITTSVNKLTFTKNGSNITRDITVNNVLSLGRRNPLTERNAISGIYTYGTYSNTDNLAPTGYFETLGFGEGVSGTIEIGGNWTGGQLYWRALRDCCDNWYSWKTILDSSNYSGILDSRYYTESEVNNLLSNKLNTSDFSWTNLPGKLVAGNEFNIVNAGFKEGMWFNYLPINDRSKTATITGYHFGNGATGYTSINASGFIKKGSSSNYVLLGDGGHKLESSLNVANADKVDGYHETAFPRLVGIKGNTWNWNDVIRAGYYKIQSGTITNHPSGIYLFGMAEVITTENHNDGENRELQIYYPHIQTNNIAIWLRMHNSSTQGNGWGSWVGVPNTNGNIASATKLQTPRTIWGQSFDGTGNVDNTLRIKQTTGNYCEGIRIQNGDNTWATIILGATGDSGTNANAWSIHRKSDNNFAISRNSLDGTNGLVMTSVGMGLGTTAPTHRLDVRGDTKITGSIRDLAIGGGIYWNPYVESTTDSSDAASITVVRSGVEGGTTLVLSLMNDANDTILFLTNTAARLYHNSYPILTTLNTYVSNNKGYINGTEITYVNNSGNADTLDGLHANAFATASHSHPYLPLSGGTMTGLIVGNNKGGSWILGRSNATIYQPRTTTDDWHPVVGFKTKTGSWEFGNVGNDDFATFSWESDSNYSSGTNTNIRVNLRNSNGTIALTSDIPTKSSWNYDDRYYTRTESDNRFVNVTGDTMSGTLTFNNVTSGLCEGILWTCGDNDFARIKAGATGSNAGYLEIATADDGNEPIYVRQYTGVFSTLKRTLTLLDGSGNTIFPGTASSSGFIKSGSNNNYVLLGGGGHKAISSFSTSGHNHDERYMRVYLESDVAPTSTNGYWSAMTTQSGISGDWWHIIHTDWNGAASWRSELALPTQGRNGIRYRSDSNGESGWAFGSWVKLLDENNWSNYCAAASHSHSYLPLSGGTLTGALTIKNNNWNNILILNRTSASGTWGPSIIFQYDGTTNGTLTMTSNLLYIGDNGSNRHKAWHEGNDGSGSGLDADTIDGKHASAFALSSHTHSYLPLAGGTMTGNITYKAKGTSYIGNGSNDAAYGVGGALNNLVISSWYGVSFTTSCSGQTYTGTNAVSINCRNGYVYANTFVGTLSGNATSATKLATARSIFGKSFNGTANVSGQGLFYGTYTSSANARYSKSGLLIRENDLVQDNLSDIGYAPSIGFHWGSKAAATMLLHSDGNFYFRKIDGVTRASLDANIIGNASTATALTSSAGSATTPIYFSNGKPVACTYSLNKTVPSNAVFTDHTYNFYGVAFYSGNAGNLEHNADSAVSNGLYYYNSKGPATTLGASNTDGALYVLSYSSSWVGQIALDYRNGGLYVRGKNNGKWTNWVAVLDSRNYNSYVSPKTHTHSVKINGSTKTIAATGGAAVDLGTYLTSHLDIYELTILVNGTLLGTYIPNLDSKIFNITCSAIGAATKNHTHSYLPLAGGTMDANARIALASSNLYIGTSNSTGWVYLLDMASLKGADYWAIALEGGAYFKNTVTASTFIGALNGNATTATTASKLGSSTVGSGTKHFYLNSGTATASSSTVGGTAKPMYLNAGTMTAISATVGSIVRPVYFYEGTIMACSSSLTDYLRLTGGLLTGDLYVERETDASIWTRYLNKTAIRMVASSSATFIQCGNYSWTDNAPMYITGPNSTKGSTLYLKFSTVNASDNILASHFYENSDIRYKRILKNLLIDSNTIANLPLFNFEWIENNTIGTGTSAQAVLKILPNIVSGNEKLTLDYGVLGTIAGITACKELVKVNIEIFTLKSELLQLKEKVKLLEDKLRKYTKL